MRRVLVAGLVAIAAVVLACGESSTQAGQGFLEVRLTDAPLSADSVDAVNVFVVRVDVRVGEAEEAEAADLEDDPEDDGDGGWVTVAEPGAAFNLVVLQGGVTALLGVSPVPAGPFHAIRLVIDETQSNIVLKNGTVLSGEASPFVKFPSGAQSGIKVRLAEPIEIVAGQTVVTLIDFDLTQSFVMRGTAMQNGLIFRPVLRAATSVAP